MTNTDDTTKLQNKVLSLSRMLQVIQENNAYKQKVIYTLISLIFLVLILIVFIYVYFSKNK